MSFSFNEVYDTTVSEWVTIGDIKIPVFYDLPVGLNATRELLAEQRYSQQISETELYLRLFCAYSQEPEATQAVKWHDLKRKRLPRTFQEEIISKMQGVLAEVTEIKEALEAVRKADEAFNPQDEIESDEGNSEAGETQENDSNDS